MCNYVFGRENSRKKNPKKNENPVIVTKKLKMYPLPQ